MVVVISGIKFHNVKEVADRFPVTEQTIKNWCRSGRLKSRKIGREIYITEDDINEFLELRGKGE